MGKIWVQVAQDLRSTMGRILPLPNSFYWSVKSSFSCCISLVWKFQNVVCGNLTNVTPLILCHLIDSSYVLPTTPRGQGRGWIVIPGFAVRYISIMLPSQRRHLMCQSQTVVLPAPSFSTYARRVTREEGTTSFSFALLNLPFLIESRKGWVWPLLVQRPDRRLLLLYVQAKNI